MVNILVNTVKKRSVHIVSISLFRGRKWGLHADIHENPYSTTKTAKQEQTKSIFELLTDFS